MTDYINPPRADKHPAFIIVSPALKAVCTRGRVQYLRDQLLSPDRHRVVVHEPCHQQAGTPVEEEVRSELATEVIRLGEWGVGGRGVLEGWILKSNSNCTLKVFPGIPEPGLPGPSVHAFSSLSKSSLAFLVTKASGKTTHKDTESDALYVQSTKQGIYPLG